ncbi:MULTISPECIES: PTS sugar transporter subunit IIC [Klebsiella/Raoultella group]|uniref:Permease IIC component n=2 Tax=Raoultella terrigena TaxID=577 RepID=A0A6D1S6W0_RAOTE|nr:MULTISPECIES: PTS sugar transporter subunit IIC [Klebsiella/Raoultella group]AJF73169.1 cytochrome C biogenesis protein CcmF [Raoultella ornithinolytica]MCS5871543.1 PTS sugar transporter subunit IIC [Klebsiella variicola subsp. variicola]MDE4647740.1 PTS sugar transporter subunit IIC [Klebsiella quasipneumoniae subsp. similipneumoniae]MDZ0575042.1 PTS sugar transporter subunit IIC [Klebsiella variicola]MEB7600752.1 PTS sugar transporter subunit IIC [Raoultella terrigena]
MNSFYNFLVGIIEKRLAPMAGVIAQQRYVLAIRDGFIAALPFMIVGSFMLVFIFPPISSNTTFQFAKAWLNFSANYREQLMLPFNMSMGLMTIFISVGVGASLGKQYSLDPITTGLLSLMSFMLVAADLKNGALSMQYFSGQGIFTALLCSIYATEVYRWLKKRNITIKLPEQVPPGVSRSFEVLIPVIVIMITLHPLNLFIEHATGMILPEAIMAMLKPLVAASDSLLAVILAVLLCQILWFAGIHGTMIVTGIMNPFWMANLASNQAALAAGEAIPHTFVQGFWDHFLFIGGVGSTLPLAILLIRSRAAHLRTIGRMGFVPGLFNINEPILFGAPIIMNPILFIPFVFIPVINAILAWYAIDLGLVEKVVMMTAWTTPAPIGASWATNWAIAPVILCFICMAIAALMYYPFVKAYEKTLLAADNSNVESKNEESFELKSEKV